jgi:hypothetical protein
MGAIQSYLTTEALVALLVISGAVGYNLAQRQVTTSPAPAPAPATSASGAGNKKGGKKKKQDRAAESVSENSAPASPPVVVAFPDVVPGGFDAPSAAAPTPALESAEQGEPVASAAKKSKKKKAKKPAAAGTLGVVTDDQSDAASSTAGPSQPAVPPASASAPGRKASKKSLAQTAAEDAESWTRVETRKKSVKGVDGAPVSSDAGITTEVTGTSSPATAGTDAGTEAESGNDEGAMRKEETRRPLAERLLPKPRKTGVDE